MRNHLLRTAALLLITAATSLAAGGCATTRGVYYSAWEKLGYEKRDILVSRVKDARNDQDKAKEQFKTTLQRFQEVTGFQGGDLEAKYKALNASYESCVSRADAVRGRIKSVETVANDMFAEWEKELAEYKDPTLKANSEKELAQTRERYQQLITVMKQAAAKMDPVLARFHDYVLALKHSLNAAAIASLQTTAVQIQGDVQGLIKDMEASIAEADAFVKNMK